MSENNGHFEAAIRLSKTMGTIAEGMHEILLAAAGEPVAFMLVTQVDGVVTYVSNGDRVECKKLLTELLDRWENDQDDTPAHLNPEFNPNAK